MPAFTTFVSTFLPFFLNTAILYPVMARPPAAAGGFHLAPAVRFPPAAPRTSLTFLGFDSAARVIVRGRAEPSPSMLTADTAKRVLALPGVLVTSVVPPVVATSLPSR